MSLIKCRECGKEISTKAGICPNCGAPRKAKKRSRFLILLGILAGIILFGHITGEFKNDKTKKTEFAVPIVQKTDEELRDERIGKHFSPWDGSHRGLTAYIKTIMNDPDSYKHVETKYWDNGDHLIILTTFRGKNAFGGVVPTVIRAKVDLDGNVIEIISQE